MNSSRYAAVQILSPDNPVFRTYIFYSAVLVIKTLLVVPLLWKHRLMKILKSSSDTAGYTRRWLTYGSSPTDPEEDRIKRAHLNDIENIPIFLITGILFLFTNPTQRITTILFLLYTLTRIFYTIVYAVVVVPQPARAILFAVGQCINVYMALCVAVHFASKGF